MTDLNALADRVEEARGGDRLTDAEIEVAVGNWSEDHYRAWLAYEEAGEMASELIVDVPVPPRWLTGSLDTAMMLVPEGMRLQLSEWDDEVHLRAKGAWQAILTKAGSGSSFADMRGFRCDHAATPALALTAACLRARATGGSHG